MNTNIEISFVDVLPYIVSVLCAIIAGVSSYIVARKQTKADIAKLEKQHSLDIEKEREKFELEKEKMEIQHQHEMELKDKDLENSMGENIMNTVFAEAMKTPEVRQQISQGMRQGNKKHKKRK